MKITERFIGKSDQTLLDAAIVMGKELKGKEVTKDVEKFKGLVIDADDVAYALVNDGIDPSTGGYLSPLAIEDSISKMTKDAGLGTSSIINQVIITRAIQMLPEPSSIFHNFSTAVSYKPGTQITTPYMGAANGARMIGVASEYPIIGVDQDQETISSTNKYGIAVQFPEETIKQANYDIVRIYMQKALEALSRLKNKEAISLLLNKGRTLYDNLEPDAAVFGETTGRGLKDSGKNGSMTLKDLYNAYMDGIDNGYIYDTILMSTFGFMVFMGDPSLKDFVRANGGPIFSRPNGTVGKDRTVQRKANASVGTGSFNNLTANVPTELMNVNFKFVVTPYVKAYREGQTVYKNLDFSGAKPEPYLDGSSNPVKCGENKMTDIILIDSSNALLHLVEEKVSSDKVEDKMIDVTKIKFKERYRFTMLEKGRGVGLIRNVTITEDTFDYYNTARPTVTEAKDALNN